VDAAGGFAHRVGPRGVVAEVGFAPETITDVVVSNPVADPNGITFSLLDTPRIVLYTEPPGPELSIGEFATGRCC
jgi:hypothetical protein